MSDDLLDRIEEQAGLAAGLAPFAADALKDAADEIRRLRIVEERLNKRVREQACELHSIHSERIQHD